MLPRMVLAENWDQLFRLKRALTIVLAGFNDPEPVIDSFKKAAEKAIAQGADVIVPGEGPMNVFLATQGISRIGDVPVVDSFGSRN